MDLKGEVDQDAHGEDQTVLPNIDKDKVAAEGLIGPQELSHSIFKKEEEAHKEEEVQEEVQAQEEVEEEIEVLEETTMMTIAKIHSTVSTNQITLIGMIEFTKTWLMRSKLRHRIQEG